MFLFRWCFPYAEATSLRRVCVCPGPSPRTTPCATGACCRGRGSTAAASVGEAPPASTNLQVSSTEYWLTNHKQGKLVRHTDQPISSEENLYGILAYQSWARKNSRYIDQPISSTGKLVRNIDQPIGSKENVYGILANGQPISSKENLHRILSSQSAASKTCTEYWPTNHQQGKSKSRKSLNSAQSQGVEYNYLCTIIIPSPPPPSSPN